MLILLVLHVHSQWESLGLSKILKPFHPPPVNEKDIVSEFNAHQI